MASVHLDGMFCPPISFKMKFGTRSKRKKNMLNSKRLSGLCLSVGEQPKFCASLCSFCEGKEGAKAICITCFHE